MLLTIYKKLRKRLKKDASPPPVPKDTIRDIKGDPVDYDGMGDWGRFPPIKK